MNDLPPGRYRHFKGNNYTVLGVARHSETQEELVVYRQEYGDHGLWVRPKAMFLETVTVAGRQVQRFEHLSAQLPSTSAGIQNLFECLPPQVPEELVQTLLTAANVRIERIISHGQASPPGFWYDQDEHEWVLVLKGAARLAVEGEGQRVAMKPGDYINIPAHKKHRIEWTTPEEMTVWLAVFYGDYFTS